MKFKANLKMEFRHPLSYGVITTIDKRGFVVKREIIGAGHPRKKIYQLNERIRTT